MTAQEHAPTAIRAGQKLRISTFAVPLSGNKGSASMLIGLLDGLAAEGYDVDALVYSYYPERDAEIARDMKGVRIRGGHPRDLATLVPLLALNRVFGSLLPKGMRRTYEELKACDVVCCVGGTTFADSMLYKVPWNILAALPGLLVGRPVVFLSQTMGPFQRPLNRAAARWTLSRAKAVHGRGQRSTDLVRSLGIEQARYWPDLSLTMRLDEARDSPRLTKWIDALEARAAAAGRRPVGITPNTIVDGKTREAGIDYPALLVAAMIDLHKRGYPLMLLPHSFREGTTQGHNNDTQLCRAILDRLPKEIDCLYVEEDLSSQELRVLISRLDFLLASRFHSMVSALSVGVPPVTLGWGDQKYIEVLEAFQLPGLYVDYKEASLQALRERIDWLDRNRDEVRDKMADGLRQARALSDHLGLEFARLGGTATQPPAPPEFATARSS